MWTLAYRRDAIPPGRSNGMCRAGLQTMTENLALPVSADLFVSTGELRTLAYLFEYHSLGAPLVPHRRKEISAKARQIARTLSDRTGRKKVLLIAAGSSPDLALLCSAHAHGQHEVVLNDARRAATSVVAKRLTSVARRLQTIEGNILKSAVRLSNLAPFDLVLAGGLFDYLPNNEASFLLKVLSDRLLVPGGRLFFTHHAGCIPEPGFTDYRADLPLIGRSEEGLRRMVAGACDADAAIESSREAAGLTWLVTFDRPGVRPACETAEVDRTLEQPQPGDLPSGEAMPKLDPRAAAAVSA